MKTPVLITLLLLATLVAATAQSTDDKAVAKEWKKKMKETDPLEFKRIVEERDAFRNETDRLRSESSTKDQEIETLRSTVEKQKLDFDAMSRRLGQLEQGGKSLSPSNAGSGSADDPNTGVVFKVQIGSFKNRDLTKYFDNNKNFSGEVEADGTKKYTLGSFRDYWEADNFKKYLREMGVADAWIVSYKDGKRVPVKDVLEGAL